mgnify:CR=1
MLAALSQDASSRYGLRIAWCVLSFSHLTSSELFF